MVFYSLIGFRGDREFQPEAPRHTGRRRDWNGIAEKSGLVTARRTAAGTGERSGDLTTETAENTEGNAQTWNRR